MFQVMRISSESGLRRERNTNIQIQDPERTAEDVRRRDHGAARRDAQEDAQGRRRTSAGRSAPRLGRRLSNLFATHQYHYGS